MICLSLVMSGKSQGNYCCSDLVRKTVCLSVCLVDCAERSLWKPQSCGNLSVRGSHTHEKSTYSIKVDWWKTWLAL